MAYVSAGISIPTDFQTNFLMLLRWIHLIAGITWIGLLYFFNLVNVPLMKELDASTKGKVMPALMLRALFWFRWSAVVTWVTGAIYLAGGFANTSVFVYAFALQPGFRTIGVGAWLGTIMLFNVWVFIWPNQKKILGIVPATDDEKAAARKIAARASRINFILSLPMLMCMGGQMHGLPF